MRLLSLKSGLITVNVSLPSFNFTGRKLNSTLMVINAVLQGTENSLIIVRRDDLIEFATTLVDRVMANQPRTLSLDGEEKPISQTEAVAFLGKSRQTLIAWRKKGYINAYRISGRIYYKPSELVSALEKLKEC